MPKIEFFLSDEMMDRLFAIKDRQGENDLTGNEFARQLLERELYQLQPEKDINWQKDDWRVDPEQQSTLEFSDQELEEEEELEL